jgi:hypothetical protein
MAKAEPSTITEDFFINGIALNKPWWALGFNPNLATPVFEKCDPSYVSTTSRPLRDDMRRGGHYFHSSLIFQKTAHFFFE